jgi:septum formation protein
VSAPRIHLASQSPRRRELVARLGVDFGVTPVAVDETPLEGEAPELFAVRAALAKARAGLKRLGGEAAGPVLGADTVVVVDEHILGKPRDRRDALDMLDRLSGRVHLVLTGVALAAPGGEASRLSVSHVTFRRITPAEASAYWDTGEPCDKAGAYAIQGLGAVFAERLEGSYSGVMGLPLFETAELLAGAGIEILSGRTAPVTE